ncbi:MAG: hypothetical protein WCH98_07095 [Verrucomicrobiota bacterium]
MDQSNPLASNLLYRLSQYVPSRGEKRTRRPLEDFCTEALAYCLIHSDAFLHAFIREILFPEKPQDALLAETDCEVGTQQSVERRRADMVLKFANKAIGIEVKLQAQPGEDQIKDCANAFDHAFLLAPRRRRLELISECNAHDVQFIAWEDVQRLSSELSGKTAHTTDNLIEPNILKLFADFLETQGLGYLAMKHHPMNCNSLHDSTALIREWKNLFSKLQLGGFRPAALRNPQFEEDNEKNESLGCYGSAGHFQWVGFEITCEPDGIFCHYQEEFDGLCQIEPECKVSPEFTRTMWMWETDSVPAKIGLGLKEHYPPALQSASTDKLCDLFENLQKMTRDKALKLSLKEIKASD